MKTIIYKSFHGWMGESQTEANANGKAWQINTIKSGKGVACTATEGNFIGGNFSFDMIGGKRIKLIYEEGMCNEKRVTDVHTRGLIEFQKQIDTLIPKDVYTVGVGQIIFTDFVSDIQSKRVVYEVISAGKYKTVGLDGKLLQIDSRIKPYSEKFGIGSYYKENDILPIEEVNILVEAATIWEEIQKFQQNETAIKNAEYKANAILEGSKVISSIPSDAVSIIIAELMVNDSDIYTDYFASHATKTVYLAFSKTKKDSFAEMRKAALNFPETVVYGTVPPTEAGYTPKDEHREKYTGGSGYYLGDSKYSGWNVRKDYISNDLLERLQIAAFEGRFFCNTEVNATEITIKSNNSVYVDDTVKIVEYGKGLAVIGNTKPLKDIFNEMKGIFNFHLKCGQGWVFPKAKLEALETALNLKLETLETV